MTTINIRQKFRLQTYRQTFTNYKKANWTQFTKDTELAFKQTTIPDNIHTANRIFTNIILLADKHNIPKGRMHNTSRLLPEHTICKFPQRDNIRRANPCDPLSNLSTLRLLPTYHCTNKTCGRSTLMLIGITGTTHTLYGRLFMVSPIELHLHHKTAP